jgi:hypothetical protein
MFLLTFCCVRVSAEMRLAQAGECFTYCDKFYGPCFSSGRCNDVCMKEGKGYSGGKCRGIYPSCYCITPCGPATSAPAAYLDKSAGPTSLSE